MRSEFVCQNRRHLFFLHPLNYKEQTVLPTGETLPPHLSPFVGERRVGDYIPPEERQLTATADTPDVAALEQEEQDEEEEEESEMSEEEQEEGEEKEEVKEGRREKTDKEAEKKMQETEEYRWFLKLHKLFFSFTDFCVFRVINAINMHMWLSFFINFYIKRYGQNGNMPTCSFVVATNI
jgi:hypothetical protein